MTAVVLRFGPSASPHPNQLDQLKDTSSKYNLINIIIHILQAPIPNDTAYQLTKLETPIVEFDIALLWKPGSCATTP